MQYLIFFFSLLCYFLKSETVSDFQGKSFKFTNKQSQIYEVDVGLPENFEGIISAYGDFNGDKAVDVVVIDQVSNNIKILYWDSNQNIFESKLVCGENCYPQKNIIQGIIPLDYDYDGLLDMMVVLDAGTQFTLNFLRQQIDEDGSQIFTAMQEQHSSISYPFVGDFLGNHRTTILISNSTSRYIVQNAQNDQQNVIDFADLVSSQEGCYYSGKISETLKTPLLQPHFSSFVDISSDCRSDLIITSELGIEYWYTTYVEDSLSTTTEDQEATAKIPRYCLIQIDTISSTTLKSLDFVDVNFDGTIDMLYVFEQSNLQYLVINYNQYVNPITPSNLCQYTTSKSSQSKQYPYILFQDIISTSKVLTTALITQLKYNEINLKLYDYSKINLNLGLAPFIRFGDYLATGYPGAFILIYNETTNLPNVYYLQNIAISTDCQLESRMCRQLIINNDPGDKFNLITSVPAINAAFFDYGENGRLDFLLNNIKQNTDNSYTFGITAFYNYISLDAFFLKSLGLDGQCAANEESQITCQGALYYGSTYQFRVTDISGSYKPAAGIQLYQSAYTPLQLPYSYMGLGRTNNYIENFYLGIPLLNGQYKQWTPIIPNSQLIVAPYSDDTKQWTLSIFIEPTEAILAVVIVTVIILLILGGVIIYKHIKEKEDDKKNQEQFFQMFR